MKVHFWCFHMIDEEKSQSGAADQMHSNALQNWSSLDDQLYKSSSFGLFASAYSCVCVLTQCQVEKTSAVSLEKQLLLLNNLDKVFYKQVWRPSFFKYLGTQLDDGLDWSVKTGS